MRATHGCILSQPWMCGIRDLMASLSARPLQSRRRPPPVTAHVPPVPYGLFTFLCCSCRGPRARAEPIGSTLDVHICCSPPFLLCGLILHELKRLMRSNFTQFNTLLINFNHRQPCLFHQGERECARSRSPGTENRAEMIFSS